MADNTTPTLDETKSDITSNYDTARENIGLLDISPSTDTLYKTPRTADATAAGATTKDVSTYNTEDTSVASQLSKILSSNSDYMKQVDAKSKELANNLGMLSSDRYIGAATGSAIREALPIATADATTASKFVNCRSSKKIIN